MKQKIVYWVPRILSILYVLFISMFAFDAFSGGAKWYQEIGGFARHLVPSFIFIVATIVAWKREIVGTILFLLLGVLTIFAFDTYKHVVSLLTITLPLLVTGGFYWWSWKKIRMLKVEEKKEQENHGE